MILKALIFDVDGTLAETEDLHRQAFNQAFVRSGSRWGMADWYWDSKLYGHLLSVAGGKERILFYWREISSEVPSNASECAKQIHKIKTAIYGQLIRTTPLRPGVADLIEEAFSQGLQLAIATTTSPENVRTLLQNTIGGKWSEYFTVIEDASTASRKKPDPMVYSQALSRLGLEPSDCVVFEDSALGLRAAQQAGLQQVVVTPAMYSQHDLFDGAMKILPSLQGIDLQTLAAWLQ